ncbi:MAG: energy-coupling factor transporter transmembrane protein EcfT [Clostridia bacterium]|nr:energy-coupling factor transporter transmembrane protein EcfT [Clostridia bacterium]
MLGDITLGQFYPTNSIIHKLDPRVKIMIALLIIVGLFVADSFYAYLLCTLFIAIAVFLSKVPVGFIFKGLKPLLFIMVFTAVINVFLTDGRTLFKVWFLRATYEGVIIAFVMVLRLFLLVTATTLLTLTTSPIMLTDGIERLLKPFNAIKVPSHEIAMMMTIALRFIPTLLEETDKIIKAQSARGADFTTGSILKRAKAMIPILIPLFISSFKRADELATAMECRCYKGGDGRTKLKVLKCEKRDYIALFSIVILLILIIFLNIFAG